MTVFKRITEVLAEIPAKLLDLWFMMIMPFVKFFRRLVR